MHNDVVKSEVHSTDTHGYSKIIFGTTHLLGILFAPRIRKLGKSKIYAFKEMQGKYRKLYYKLLPNGYINEKLIRENYEDILRFIATIKLKRTTASQLFNRLNSYSTQHVLYKGLKEFGKILKSIFILKYIDEVELRQAIEKQLSIVENANKFAKAVGYDNNQEFLQQTKEEQILAESCRRLIQCAIICWNYFYINKQLVEEQNSEKSMS